MDLHFSDLQHKMTGWIGVVIAQWGSDIGLQLIIISIIWRQFSKVVQGNAFRLLVLSSQESKNKLKQEPANVWHFCKINQINMSIDQQINRLIVQTTFLSWCNHSFPEKGIQFRYQLFPKAIKPPVGTVWLVLPELSTIIISSSTKLQTNKQCFLIVSCPALSPNHAFSCLLSLPLPGAL